MPDEADRPGGVEDSLGDVGLVMTATAAGYYGQDGGASVAATIPMGRMAQPADVASACLFLASPLAGYVTGADLAVHGGGEVPARYFAARSDSDSS